MLVLGRSARAWCASSFPIWCSLREAEILCPITAAGTMLRLAEVDGLKQFSPLLLLALPTGSWCQLQVARRSPWLQLWLRRATDGARAVVIARQTTKFDARLPNRPRCAHRGESDRLRRPFSVSCSSRERCSIRRLVAEEPRVQGGTTVDETGRGPCGVCGGGWSGPWAIGLWRVYSRETACIRMPSSRPRRVVMVEY